MSQKVQISVLPHQKEDKEYIKNLIAGNLNIKKDTDFYFELVRENIDARKKTVKYVLTYEVFVGDTSKSENTKKAERNYLYVENGKPIYIVGAGPAGLFAALKAIELGLKPIIVERGKPIKERRRDLAKLNKQHIVNNNSNYCFGEGGAGTYSDGKLYTRSKKRGNQQEILEKLVEFGASQDILVNAHPHIGTNKLPQIIENIRNLILKKGGLFLFQHKLTDIKIENKKVKELEIQNLLTNETYSVPCNQFMLATGHSARDIFELLHKNEITIEFKPFALGVRVEHPQELINQIQYHCTTEELSETMQFLPSAAYSWVEQVNGKGVYSFCMCPGGIIAPCATSEGEIVTNGWSPSKRNNPWANSGIVTEIGNDELKDFQEFGPFSGLEFQKFVENKMWIAGGKTQSAPAQRLIDFLNNKKSTSLPKCSYLAGITSSPLHEVLPPFLVKRLQKAFKQVGKKMKGYLSNEAVIVATESRTSSPIRIPRNKETYCHIDTEGLYPVGEGAGYAGGIVSAAMDGSNSMEKIFLVQKN